MLKLFAIGGVVTLWTAFIVCWLYEKGVFKDAEKRLKAQSWLTRAVCGGMLAVAIVYGGTKPDYGGGSSGGDGGTVTNVVEGADGGSVTNYPGGADGGSGTNAPSGGLMMMGRFGGAQNPVGSDDGETGEATMELPATNVSRIARSAYAAGFVFQGVGTNETFDFNAPEGAFVATNWVLHGASSARVSGSFTDWTFPFGDGFVTNLVAFASGTVMPDIMDTNVCFSVFSAPLGVVPEANWDLLGENDRPSVFWWTLTEMNSLLVTWQNVLLDRCATNPVSFQVEFRPGGSFTYRYDLTRLASDDLLTNVAVGVRSGGGAWFSPAVDRSLTSLAFQRVTAADLANPDRDGDGIPTEVEIFGLGTDPDLADTDFDGIPDGVEVAANLDPLNRDSDGDGLVDGSDPVPLTATADTDADCDGIGDEYERYWFGDTNVVDDATAAKEDGFTLDMEILAGINPTNAASSPVVYVTNSLVSWKMVDAFAAERPQGASALVWQRTFRISKTSPWQQYFVSAAPDSAAGWMLEGMRLEWEDSFGGSGLLVRSPSGDSFRVPVSTNGAENLTLRLVATGRRVRTATPLHLLAYVPELKVEGGREVMYNGTSYSVFTDGSDSSVGLTIDRTHRPCNGPLSDEESDMGVLSGMEGVSEGGIAYEGDVSGGTLAVYRPGAYPFPQISASLTPPVLRRMLRSGGGGGGHVLLILDPSVWYGEDHCYAGSGLGYDWTSDTYYYEEHYPLNSKCLWGNWSRDYSGGWYCNCEPEVSSGIGDYDGVSTDFDTEGEKCTGVVKVGDEVVWSGKALHLREYGCGGSLTHSELLTELDECESCEDSCTGGSCQHYDGTELGSLAFRVSVGSPRRGQTDGFAYFKTDDPIIVTPSTFSYLFRDDASVTVTTNGNSRHVVCMGERGRDIVIESVSGAVRMTVRDRLSGTLDHAWEFSNVDGSASRIRIRKISRLDNPLEDWTFTYDGGDWTRFDNLKQVSEELCVEDGINDPWDGAKREWRTVRDAGGNELSSVYSESHRYGECENAVIRETYRYEWTGLNGRTREADYWFDPGHRARHGKLRLLTGNDRPWEYHDFDESGCEILRVEQRNGSEIPGSFPVAVSNVLTGAEGLSDAYVTVFDYTPLAGDGEDGEFVGKVRTETKYVVAGGVATMIGRTWWRYTTDFAGGREIVKAERWRAGSAAGGATPNADGNAYSYETTFTDSGIGTPLVMRGQVSESLDESGLLTVNAYIATGAVVTCMSRSSFSSGPLPTYTVTDYDAAYGLVVRRATHLTDGGRMLDEERSFYDEKNRLRSTVYSDGTSTTNAYSCCRLLWRRDRECRRVLRSGVTGYDQLYNADEDVWLADISTNGGYRVTQRFFDGLGRETNTLTYVGFVPGEANDWQSSRGKVLSSVTTGYPNGGSDLAIRTDERGRMTTTRTDLLGNCIESGEEVFTNGVRVTATKNRSVFGGGSSTRREWGEMDWTEERRFTEYAADGRRLEFSVVESPDCGIVTNSVTVYDLLGRAVSQSVPGGNGAWIETRSFYDGVSGRLVRTEVDGSPDVTYGYDAMGERTSTSQNGIVNRVVTSYETVSGEVWRVRTNIRIAPGADDIVSTERVQLTGLSDVLRSRRVSVSASGKVTRTESSFDAADNIVTTVVSVDGVETESSRSLCGLLLSASTIDGSESRAYDALGREATVSSFAIGADAPRARQTFAYDASGNIVETDSDYGAEGTATASSAFDALGREVSSTDPSARTVETGCDGQGRTVSVGGDTHPLMSGYDSAGRKTQGLTTRDGGETWDATTWTYDSRSGLNTAKRYADGSQISYAYTDNGRKTRTTWARGVWKQNAYDAANRISGVTYSDGTPGVACSYTGAGKVAEAAVAGGAQYVYGYNGRLLCTNEAFSVGADRVDVVRTYDNRSRCDLFAVEVTNVAHAVKTRRFDAYGRVVGYGITNACGRGMTASLQYTGSRVDGITYTLPNGGTFTSTFTRSPSRPDLVTRRDYRFGSGSIYWYETGYDLAGRPTNAVDSVSLVRAYLYNRRNELAEASVGTNAFGYAYDSIGNRTSDTFNGASRNYAANCLNQYTQVDAAQMVYDTDGNLVRDDRFDYAYDAENRMLSARPFAPSEGDLAVVNAYDHKHRRVMKRVERFDGDEWQTSETHTFVYDGSNIVLERIAFANGTTRTVEYFWDNDLSGTEQGAGGVGGLVAVSVDGAFFIPCYDHNGNIVCYVSVSGTIAAQYVYDPYGNVIEQCGTLAGRFAIRFSTKYTDIETGLISYLRRFYRPDHGRWLNRDPIEERGGENLYAFCSNCPPLYYDYLGMDFWGHFFDAIQTAAGIATAVTGAGMMATAGWTGIGAVAGFALFTLGVDQATYGVYRAANRLMEKDLPTGTPIQCLYRAGAYQITKKHGSGLEESLDVVYFSANILASCGTAYISASRCVTAVRSVHPPRTELHWGVWKNNTVEAVWEMNWGISIGKAGSVVATEAGSVLISVTSFFDDHGGENDGNDQ